MAYLLHRMYYIIHVIDSQNDEKLVVMNRSILIGILIIICSSLNVVCNVSGDNN